MNEVIKYFYMANFKYIGSISDHHKELIKYKENPYWKELEEWLIWVNKYKNE